MYVINMAEVTKQCECLELQIKKLKEQLFVFSSWGNT